VITISRSSSFSSNSSLTKTIAQRTGDDITPFDNHDAVGFEQFAECKISHLAGSSGGRCRHDAGDAACRVTVHQCTSVTMGWKPIASRSPGERRLAGTIACQHDQIAAAPRP
jgi:hypothetical protein